jgi:hypothetical protein
MVNNNSYTDSEKLKRVEQALKACDLGDLSELQTLLAINSIVRRQEPKLDDMEWAERRLKEIEVGIDAISSEDMPSTRMAKWWNEYADEAGNRYLLRPSGTDAGISN